MQGVNYSAALSQSYDLAFFDSRSSSVESSLDFDSLEESSLEQVSQEEGSLEQVSQEEGTLEQGSEEESSLEQDSKEESSLEQGSEEESSLEEDSQEEGSLEQGSLEIIQEDLDYIKEGLTISVLLLVVLVIAYLFFKIKKELEIYF